MVRKFGGFGNMTKLYDPEFKEYVEEKEEIFQSIFKAEFDLLDFIEREIMIADSRWKDIAKTHFEQGFMALIKWFHFLDSSVGRASDC